jgi:uncharacterized membrane protein (DUF4010 family)
VESEDLKRLALALAIGLLTGLERGWQKREEPEGSRVAGVRTFGLMGLLGGASALLARTHGPIVLAAAFVALAALLSAGYARGGRERDVGATTETAALLTFALAALGATGFGKEAAAAAVVMTLLLSLKPVLHRWVAALGRAELRASLQFLALSVVVLPFLPDRGFGPEEALNPFELWLTVVLISGLSFAGYAAVKRLGPKAGVATAAALGGLVSSTAVTLALARRDRAHPAAWRIHAAGVVLASTIMLGRVLVVAGAVNPPLLKALGPPLAAMAAVGLIAAALLARGEAGEGGRAAELRNPLQLGASLAFGLTLAAVTLAIVLLRRRLGESGVYGAAALSGVVDVDSVTLSLARMGRGDLGPETAARGILVAVGVNTLAKAAFAAAIARGRLGLAAGAALGAALAAGAAALALS